MIKQSKKQNYLNNKWISLLNSDPIKAGLVKDSHTLHQAQRLLYHCYVKKMKWQFEETNASGICVDHTNSASRLVDDYDNIAEWFSVVQNNAVVACARLCPEDTQGRLELERYSEATKMIWPELLALKKKFRVLELNREAVHPNWAVENTVHFLLLKEIFQYCLSNRYAIITTSHIQEWKRVYDRIAFPTLEGYQFKYAATDPEVVTVYFANEGDIRNMYHKLCVFLEKEYNYDQTPCFSGYPE